MAPDKFMEIYSAHHSRYTFSPGRTAPQGATLVNNNRTPSRQYQATGVNFAVYAPAATQLFLSLFNSADDETRLKMYPSGQGVWHIYVEGISAGQLYAFRADGQWSPDSSPRFNKHKLLLDPFARDIKGELSWCKQLFDYTPSNNSRIFNEDDSAPYMPRCVVRETEFDWQGVTRPQIADQKSVIYEAHPKGFTQTHPEIPEHLRGTYLGMCHPVAIDYLKTLGITALELLPVTSKVSEQRLIDLDLVNYWGYNPLCLMAPEPSYGIKDPVTEMKTMVRELHRAGIEVIMDVVFNHTGESGHGGPFFNLRGLAESEYYHIEHHKGKLSAVNYSGCGNTMNFDSPQTLKLTMDALRCWAEEYQIDGFRFDLAPIMARQHRHFTRHSPFLFAISQDPVLSQLKMIAEPWDIGPNGYHLTGFPRDWQAWNDRYRDGCRKYWKGEQGIQTEMAHRFSGSEDLFSDQSYLGTVNYICSHDGFSLMDLVSYKQRHNHDNGENNRDGDEHNYSWNNGVEGDTNALDVHRIRLRSQKNMIGMLMLAKGTPMLQAGDEFSNSQQGNNNAYCQDAPVAWMDWSWLKNPDSSDGARLNDFTSKVIHFRRNHPLFTDELNKTVYTFYSTSGQQVSPCYFMSQNSMALVVKIHACKKTKGTLVVVMNPDRHPVKVQLPIETRSQRWAIVMDTNKNQSFCDESLLNDGWFEVTPNSLVVIEERL